MMYRSKPARRHFSNLRPAQVAQTRDGWVLVDQFGARVNWPVLATYVEAEGDLFHHRPDLEDAARKADACS